MSKVGKIICGRVPRATLLWVAFVAAAPRLGEAAESIDYKSLYRRTSAAVVALMATDGSVGQRGTGSLIDAKGLVLTNTHVVTRRTKGDKGKGTDWPHLFVVLKPVRISGKASLDLKRRYRARVVARHPAWDLALVQIIDPPAGLPALPLSSLEGVGVGEPTVAIGHPGGGALWSLTTGRISGAFSDYRGVRGWDVFQTETALNPGNSGGPLLDGSGAIIGINTFIIRMGPGRVPLVGLNFAVKSTTARRWIAQTVGKLPRASKLRAPPAQMKAESWDRLARSAPPPTAAKEERTPRQKRAMRPWVLQRRSGKKRTWHEPVTPARPRSGYRSELEPGREYGGKRLRTLFERRVDETFDDMDRELMLRRRRMRALGE